MKVLHISGARSWGGNEQQLTDMLPELKKLGVENLILGVKDFPLHNYLKKTSFQFIEAKDQKLNKSSNYRYLKEIVQQHNPDIIHLHTSDSVTVFTISDLRFRLKTPAVFSKKGMGKSMSLLSIFKYNYKNIKAIICVSEAVKKSMETLVMKPKNHQKLKVVYDGINSDRLQSQRHEKLVELFPKSKDKKILGNIANHVDAKDLPTLIKAIQHMVYEMEFKDFHLIQIGEGSKLSPELKAQVAALQVEEYITFAGFQANATDFLPQMDVYVMSSEREGLPLTIYEAFYKKTPVVSTMAGGIPEIISDGKNGFLVPIYDYKGLAEKTIELLKNENLQKEFADKSYSLFKANFEANKTAANTLAVYKCIL